MIRDVTGLNEASDGSTPAERSLVGVQKLAAANSNTATRHILKGGLFLTQSLGPMDITLYAIKNRDRSNGIFYFKTDWKDYFDKVNLLFEDPNWEDLNLIDLEDHLRDIPPTSFEKKAIQANRSLNTKIVKRVI